MLGLGLQVGWGWVSGKLWGRANCVSQVDGDSDMMLACQLCGGRDQKGTMTSVSTSV